jgi:hypothetical protein
MLNIRDYSHLFMKSSFVLGPPKRKRRSPKKIIVDPLFNALTEMTGMMNDKIKIAEVLQKAMRVDNKKQQAEKDAVLTNLVYDETISLRTLRSLATHYYKLNLVYLAKCGAYVDMRTNDDDEAVFLNELGEWVKDVNLDELFEYNLDKPLKAVSGYKLSDLQEISRCLRLPVAQYTKQELYTSIQDTLARCMIHT